MTGVFVGTFRENPQKGNRILFHGRVGQQIGSIFACAGKAVDQKSTQTSSHGFRLKKWVFLDEIAAKPVLSTTCESFLATLVLMRSAGDDKGYKLLLVKDFKQCTGNV